MLETPRTAMSVTPNINLKLVFRYKGFCFWLFLLVIQHSGSQLNEFKQA
jgi:hypothetical protein